MQRMPEAAGQGLLASAHSMQQRWGMVMVAGERSETGRSAFVRCPAMGLGFRVRVYASRLAQKPFALEDFKKGFPLRLRPGRCHRSVSLELLLPPARRHLRLKLPQLLAEQVPQKRLELVPRDGIVAI